MITAHTPGEVWALEKTSSRDAEVKKLTLGGEDLTSARGAEENRWEIDGNTMNNRRRRALRDRKRSENMMENQEK